jgi:hypothetical protein
MTLFEKTIPDMSYSIQYPRQHAQEMFAGGWEYSDTTGLISEDGGDTICSRSLIMLLQQMTERICDLEREIAKLNGET